MFKSVEYDGFDSRPDLLAKAEQLTPVLENVIHRSHGEVEVTWSPRPDPFGDGFNLSLVRTLPNGVVGTARGVFTPADLAEAWLTRSRCRDVWSDVLEDLSRQLGARVQEALSESVEA